MPTDSNIWNDIQSRRDDLRDLRSRMDTDKELYRLKEFKLRDKRYNREITNVHNLTMNDPKTFADKSISILAGAVRQVVIEGEEKNTDKYSNIERFVDDFMFSVDARLSRRKLMGLYPFIVEQSVIRGHMCAVVIIRKVDGKAVADVTPWDTRYTIPEHSPDGLKSIAYETVRTLADLREEYPGADLSGGLTNEVNVYNHWGEDRNRLMVVGHEIWSQPNPFGYVPAIYVMVNSGSVLQDSDCEQFNGESIYAANRNLYGPINEFASVLFTRHMQMLKPPYAWRNRDGTEGQPPDEGPYGENIIIPMAMDEEFKEIPLADLQAAGRLFFSMLETRLQRGSLPNLDYGNLTFPLSGYAMGQLMSSKDSIYIPRFQALGDFNSQVAHMAIQQIRDQNLDIDLGPYDRHATYRAKELEGDYAICYRFFPQDPEQQIANYSMASAAEPWTSPHTIRRGILHQQDAEQEERLISVHEAELMSPNVKRYRIIKHLIQEERYTEAKLMAAEMQTSLQQIMAGELPEPAMEERRPIPGATVSPLLGSGQRRAQSVANKSAQEGMVQQGAVEGEQYG